MDIKISAQHALTIESKQGVCALKNSDSTFLHANPQFIALVGLEAIEQRRGLSDAELPCEAAADAEAFRHQDRHILKEQIAITTLNVHRFPGQKRRAFLVVKRPFVFDRSSSPGILLEGREIHLTSSCAPQSATDAVDAKYVSISVLSRGTFVISEADSSVVMTAREREVLNYLLLGCTAKRVALALSISSRTVEQYVEVLKRKFAAQSKSQLVEKAMKEGYLYSILGGPSARKNTVQLVQ